MGKGLGGGLDGLYGALPLGSESDKIYAEVKFSFLINIVGLKWTK